MFNFEFHNPVKIVFGKDTLGKLDSLVPKDARVMITYGGGSVKRFGTLDRVKDELKKSDREIFEFGGIEANPKFESLMKAVEVARENKVDFLLAVGGGSVMDGTKFIGLATNSKEYFGKEEQLLTFGFSPIPVMEEEVIRQGCVVTLPATGSEMNNGGVITRGEDKLPIFSAYSFPIFSILDPELTYSLPENQVANGIVDTFIHTVEQYVTFPSEARFQDRTAEGILQTLVEIGEKTLKNPEDYDARANLVWCATMGLNGLIGAGAPQDWSTHMIGHEMTAIFHVDHGKTLAVVQPASWRVRFEDKKEKLAQYGERVWNITSGTMEEKAELAIVKTEEFFNTLGVKTKLSDYGIDESGIDKIINGLEKHGMTALGEKGDITLEVSRKILMEAL